MNRNGIIAIVLLVIFIGLFVFRGCDSAKPKQDSKKDLGTKQETVVVQPPAFNQDSAFAFLKKQVDFGPRTPGSAAHKKCGDWMISEMKRFGANVITQESQVTLWDGKSVGMRNIICEFSPDKKKRVVLAAHYDTRSIADKDPDKAKQKNPIDGANDGASGVAVLMELARMIQSMPSNIGVDIIFFDVEDSGKPEWEKDDQQDIFFWCLGSQYWADNKHKPGYQADFGILLDMVGGKNARFNKEGISMDQAPDVVNLVWKTADRLGYGGLFQNAETGEITDDHVFMNLGGVRTIDIIDMRPSTKTMGFGGYEFNSTHHTHLDNLDNIDPTTLTAVGSTVAMVVWNVK